MAALKLVQQKAWGAGVALVPAHSKIHSRELGRLMRQADFEEIKASGGFVEPHKAVRASINHLNSKEAWAAYAGDDLLCVFGVVDFGEWAAPWLLSSIHVEKHARAFWRASKIIVADLRERYPKMVQMVYAGHTSALNWVRHLGFRVQEPERFGRAQTLFCRVSMETPKLILEAR